MLAMANNASATKVGCHMCQLSLGLCPLYCKKENKGNNEFLDSTTEIDAATFQVFYREIQEYTTIPFIFIFLLNVNY